MADSDSSEEETTTPRHNRKRKAEPSADHAASAEEDGGGKRQNVHSPAGPDTRLGIRLLARSLRGAVAQMLESSSALWRVWISSLRLSDRVSSAAGVPRGLIPNEEDDFFEAYKPKLSEPNLFDLFTANMTVDLLPVSRGAPVEAIRLPGQYSTEDSRSRTLYARAFYPELIRECFSNKCCVLVGNPGTSKSTLQFILLAAMLAPKEMRTPFPADGALSAARKALERFKVVVRQVGRCDAHIFVIKERVHMEVTNINKRLFGHFDPDTTLYLYEPEENDSTQPFRFIDGSCKVGQSLSTLSPWEARYSKYLEHVHDPSLLYMPLYTEEELVTIGEDMARQPDFPLGERLYLKEEIRHRFSQFGGVIRNVLVATSGHIAVAQKGKARAIANMTPQQALRLITNFEGSDPTAGSNSVSHQLVLLDARRAPGVSGGCDFRECTSVLADLADVKTLSAPLRQLTIAEKALFLQRTERVQEAAMKKLARTLFEDVLSHYLAHQGVYWHARPLGSDGNAAESWQELSIAPLTSPVRAVVPYGQLQEGTLAYPSIENFPFCEFYFRDFQDKANKATLVCVQVWFGLSTATREMSLSALNSFKAKVGVPPDVPIKLVLVPAHSMAKDAKISRTQGEVAAKEGDEAKEEKEWRMLTEMAEVWRAPEDYGSRAWHADDVLAGATG